MLNSTLTTAVMTTETTVMAAVVTRKLIEAIEALILDTLFSFYYMRFCAHLHPSFN
jgi:hypothetical protein